MKPRIEVVAIDCLMVRLFDAIAEANMPWMLAATRELLAAKSVADLVEWSGGLYNPPAKFRSW